MKKFGLLNRLIGLYFLGAFLVSIVAGTPVMAAAERENGAALVSISRADQPLDESIELKSPYPVLKEKAGNLFEFQVEFYYHGSQPRVFELSVLGTQGSYVDVLAEFAAVDKGIQSILVKPDQEFPDVVKVRYNPMLAKKVDPGQYVITLRASSGNLSATIELTAVVTARYDLFLNTSTGRLNVEITAGKDNHIPLRLINNSSVDLQDVRLSANVPDGWGIAFIPEVVGNLGVDGIQQTDMVITPDRNTIAGDYEIKVTAVHSETFKEVSLRITVATPTIWGWISVIVIILVITGLAAIFVRLGRR
jgi:uncharacterized membrane protein